MPVRRQGKSGGDEDDNDDADDDGTEADVVGNAYETIVSLSR